MFTILFFSQHCHTYSLIGKWIRAIFTSVFELYTNTVYGIPVIDALRGHVHSFFHNNKLVLFFQCAGMLY